MRIQCFQINALVEQHRRISQRIARHLAETETAGIGHHTGVDAGGGLFVDNQLVTEGVVKGGDHFAAGGTLFLYPAQIAVVVHRNVVVDLDQLTAQRILRIGDTRRSGGIQHNAERIAEILVRLWAVLLAEKGNEIGEIVVDERDLLFREGQS